MSPYVSGNATNRQQEVQIWQKRWDALVQAIQDTIAGLPQVAPTEKQEWQVTLESTLHCLKSFGEKQFNFFQKGFKKSGKLVDSPRYKAEYALRNTLDQVAYDLSVLQRIGSQRLNAVPREAGSSILSGPEALELADKLAYKALQPAISANLLEPTTVFTYFQKSPNVRVVPYAPIALIGIPYSCIDIVNNARDYLAIPHEVGHYVFWHGKFNGTRINAMLHSLMPSEPVWRANWLEEMFADVYGCLVAGPVLALDFQEVLFDNINQFEDDGDHPIAAIRPFFYNNILREMKQRGRPLFPNAPDKLDNKWRNLRGLRESQDSFKPGRHRAGDAVNIDATTEPMKETITMILTALQSMVPQDVSQVWSGDSMDMGTHLYADFKTAVLDTLNGAPPKLIATQNKAAIETLPVLNENDISWNAGDSSVEWFELFSSALSNGLRLLPETWNTLLDGGGWAAGGPETDHAG